MENQNLTEQENEKAIEVFMEYFWSEQGQEDLQKSLDEWFTMKEVVEQLEETHDLSKMTDEECIDLCLQAYTKIYPLDDNGISLWTETLKDMLTQCS
jgi:hypothetical protein